MVPPGCASGRFINAVAVTALPEKGFIVCGISPGIAGMRALIATRSCTRNPNVPRPLNQSFDPDW
jgi:hypothetical protein